MASVDMNIPGNWMARQLRLINDDSRDFFPSTAGSLRSRGKFNSLYTVDYPNPPEGAIYTRLEDKKQQEFIQQNRETIADVLFGSDSKDRGQMFAKWRVPERFVDTELVTALSPRRDLSPRTIEKTSFPRIQNNNATGPKGSMSARLPKRRGNSPANHKGRTAQVSSSMDRRAGMANEWMEKSPHVDRFVIDDIMRKQQRNNLAEQTMKKKCAPDARLSVEKWLQTASEQERKVALRFFEALSGSPQMASYSQMQGSRLNQAINTLQRAKTSAPAVQSFEHKQDMSNSRLQFINLLNPKERANRWRYTTWHHQPEFRQFDPVENSSSHYTRPHAPPPRHFVIHPDWG